MCIMTFTYKYLNSIFKIYTLGGILKLKKAYSSFKRKRETFFKLKSTLILFILLKKQTFYIKKYFTILGEA